MTELVEQFKKESGYTRPLNFDVYGIVAWYEAFSEWLADQLRWRPVSEKPDEDGDYFVRLKNEKDRMWIAQFCLNQWDLDKVTHWFPIPPTPEGEVK